MTTRSSGSRSSAAARCRVVATPRSWVPPPWRAGAPAAAPGPAVDRAGAPTGPDGVDQHDPVGGVPQRVGQDRARVAAHAARDHPVQGRQALATSGPAASSPRSGLPTPSTRVVTVVHRQVEEVGRARDARVVVADRLLAPPLQRVVVEVEVRLDEVEQVLLDRGLVLRGRRHDHRVGDRAPSSSCSGGRGSRGAPRWRRARRRRRADLDGRDARALVGRDQPQRLVERVDGLERPDHDAAERVAHRWTQPTSAASACRSAGSRSAFRVNRAAGPTR
jgi:hypothetical protein